MLERVKPVNIQGLTGPLVRPRAAALYFDLTPQMSSPLFPGSLLLELGHMRRLGLTASQLRWSTFLSQGKLYAGRHSSIAYVGREAASCFHKICSVQTFRFCGCSVFHQGGRAELIRGGVKACAIFRHSHLLGNIRRQQRACFSRNTPVGSAAAAPG